MTRKNTAGKILDKESLEVVLSYDRPASGKK
jgi:hypothetical protein